MPKYKVNISREEYGFCEIEANNEDEAREKAIETYDEGNIIWGKENLEVQTIEEIK